MIDLRHVTYTYPDQAQPALADFSVSLAQGEFVLVVGPSGSGKSTFLRSLNGLAPHFYGGKWSGHIDVGGRNPVERAPRGMADLVGFVFQDPEAQFVVDTVEDELAFAMENFAVPPATMRKRIEEALDQMGIAHLRQRRIGALSGGEKQRVAVAAVLALQPQILVLDEPTSQLDPQAAEEVLVALRQLNEDQGLTVIISEHRLERVAQFVDRVLYLPALGAAPILDDPRAVMGQLPLVPPLVELGRALGWQPLPLTIKEGRPFARRISGQLAAAVAGGQSRPERSELPQSAAEGHPERMGDPQGRTQSKDAKLIPQGSAISVRDAHFAYHGHRALRGVTFDARSGEFVALMGRNGSGKSTLLKCIVGLLKQDEGRITVGGLDVRTAPSDEVIRVVGYVPQHPGSLLFRDSLLAELAFTRKGHGMPQDELADLALLERLGLASVARRDPRDLSGGEQQRAALAAILVAQPQIILLDEPTRGLDYVQKRNLAALLLSFKAEGRTVVMATHDVELAAACADRVVLMGEGQIVVDGPARDVMSDSQVFASQINKLFRDPNYLVVDDVLRALGREPAAP